MKRLFKLAHLCLLAIPLPIFSQPSGAPLPHLAEAAAAWADIDADGDLDLFLSGVDSTGAAVTDLYRYTGATGFVASGAGIPALRFAACAFADYDMDGDPDMAVCGYGPGGFPLTRIYRNDAGMMVQVGGPLRGLADAALAWADLDADSDLDLFGTGKVGAAAAAVAWQNGLISGGSLSAGGASFTEAALSGIVPVSGATVRLADFTGDGITDVLLRGGRTLPPASGPGVGGEEFTAVLYRNLTGFRFAPLAAALPADTLLPGSMDVSDYDGDGIADLVLTGAGEWAGTSLNTGTGSGFIPSAGAPPGISLGCISGVNLDSDPESELALSGLSATGPTAGIFQNASGAFTLLKSLQPCYNATLVWGDYNADGRADLLLCGRNASTHMPFTRLYTQTSPGIFIP